MKSDLLTGVAFERYADAIRSGKATAYECLRFFDQWFSYQGEDARELLKKATLTLLGCDPFIFAVSPSSIVELSEEELEACVSSWALSDASMKSFLEGQLRLRTIPHDSSDLDRISRALEALECAKQQFGNDVQFLELYVEALKRLNDDRYFSEFERLISATEPEWRANPLHYALAEAAEKADWQRYDALRRKWGELPKNAHMCECYTKLISNTDGLRALEAGDIYEAIKCLRAAVTMSGCPHLNSGGPTLWLARTLLERGIELNEIKEHLEAAEQFSPNEKIQKMREQIALREAGNSAETV